MRNTIRAHWFAWRVARATDLQERVYYVSKLSGLGESAFPVLQKLALENADPSTRSLTIFALKACSHPEAVWTLGSMMHDPDQAVRESAATALAFMVDKKHLPPLELLARTARSGDKDGDLGAAAAAAGLGRIEPKFSCLPLNFALAAKPGPLARAQAIESLGVLAMAHTGSIESLLGPFKPDDVLPGFPYPKNECGMFVNLVRSLNDLEEFAGPLAIEREIAEARQFLSASGKAVETGEAARGDVRQVRDVARKVLFELTGQQFSAAPPMYSGEEGLLAAQCRQWYLDRLRSRTTSRPATEGRHEQP
ncbi:MAG TPA: HEAT repeat domain-containing protein [Phycisphaerae bacterium]|nr:HEAT repeat domain-containing protein [Phycisphaerae bacterium]